eukprot:12107164-Alexandrium_andersonii.AAC.1
MTLGARAGLARWSASNRRRLRTGPSRGSAAVAPGPSGRSSHGFRARRPDGRWTRHPGAEIS